MLTLTKLPTHKNLHIRTLAFEQHVLFELSDFEHNKIDVKTRNEKPIIDNILLEICEDCSNMAAIPQGAFAACKLREQYRDRDLIIARMRSGGDSYNTKNMGENKKLMEYNPNKYNDKLMNSIWGFYNRYSPHNIKGNDYELPQEKVNGQQQSAVAPFNIAKKLAMAVFSDNDWSIKGN